MKKMIAMVLCLATVLSFAACGQNEDTPATTQETTTQEATDAVIVTVIPEETITEETEPEETAQTETKPTTQTIQALSQKEQFEKLASVVGMNILDAVKKLGWQERDIAEVELNLFSTPLSVYLSGTKYQVFFGISEEVKVVEVIYRAELPTAQKAAGALLKTVATLDQWVGKENELETDSGFELRNTTEAAVSAAISADEYAYAAIIWDYTKQATKAQKEFIAKGETLGGRKSALGVSLEFGCMGDQASADAYTIAFSVCTVPTFEAQ